MNVNNIDVEVRVNGRPVRTYNFEGKTFIESREGSEYTIHIKNNNHYKVLAVPAVDSISTIDGKEASLKSGGYIIEPYGTYEIKGYRKDYSTVGSFKFTKNNKGYAAAKGQAKNSGIISVAFWKEKDKPIMNQTQTIIYTNPSPWYWNGWYYTYPVWYQNGSTCTVSNNCVTGGIASASNYQYTSAINSSYYNCASANTCNMSDDVLRGSLVPDKEEGLKISAQNFQHATTWGNKVEDKVTSGTFERETLVAEFNFYYDSKDGLESLGIKIVPQKQVAFPQGFNNFCEPPKMWQ